MPELLYNANINLKDQQTDIRTFVDDAFPMFTKKQNMSVEETVESEMNQIKDHMDTNHLAMNPPKTKIMLITKDKDRQNNFKVTINNK